MKRRAIITVTTCVLYVALLAVIWIIGSNQAAQKTEAQLDYAILDFRNTIDGAIDTMLGYIAKTAVSHFGTAERHTLEEMQLVANKLNIDEVNIVDRRGRIIASNDPSCLDVDMTVKKETSPFLALTNGATPTVSQHFRKHAYNTTRRKYLGVAFPGGNGFIQVGLDEQHLSKILPMILGYIFDQWLLGRTGFFLCADASTDKLISNPSRHLNEASTLSEAGFREKDAKPFETTLSNTDLGKTFKQRLFGETCYCRNYLFAGHRFVPALPEREYYDTRAIYTTVFAVLLFIVLSTFAWFINRVLHDSEQLKLFYDSREELRARDMSIAKTIQNSALPNRLPDDPRFLLAADMCAARDVGGDFYDHFQMDATHYAFLVADVSGKGITAALYMMTAKTLIKNTLLALHDPAAALTKANAELCRNNPANMFLTAWVGVIDLESGSVSFANAGHNPPAIVKRRAAAKSPSPDEGIPVEPQSPGFSMEFIRERSGPVLAFADGVKYKPLETILSKGDSLFLYTDGVTEALNSDNLFFGDDRLEKTLESVPDNTPEAICLHVRTVVAAFSAGAQQSDDITVLAIRYGRKERQFSKRFRAVRDSLPSATEFLDECLAESGCPQNARPPFDIILDELMSNIVKHSGATFFIIKIERINIPDGARLTVIDDGTAYNPLTHIDPDITLPAEKRPVGGLGLLMVKRMCDSVSYSRDCGLNRLTLCRAFAKKK